VYTWTHIVKLWRWLEIDMTTIYGVNLEKAFRRKSWRWFEVHVNGLMQHEDSLLRHRFMELAKKEKTEREAAAEKARVDAEIAKMEGALT
jgi:hypothetical protein